jgi:hypothetical protein
MGSVIRAEPTLSRMDPAIRLPCPSVVFRRGHLLSGWPVQARSHGSGSYRVDARDPVAAGGTAPL